jgi:hypothetical protein
MSCLIETWARPAFVFERKEEGDLLKIILDERYKKFLFDYLSKRFFRHDKFNAYSFTME